MAKVSFGTRLLVVVGLGTLVLQAKHAHAFCSTKTTSTTRPPHAGCPSFLAPPLLMARSSESDVKGGAVVNGATAVGDLQPHPPTIPPPAYSYQELLQETELAGNNVEQLEDQLFELRAQLAEKEAALQQGKTAWKTEKNSLVDKIVGFGSIMQEKEYELQDANQERDRLQREVTLLQDQLPTVQNMLRAEQMRAQELRDRLNDVEDTLEYQQMEFEKEKAGLRDTVEQEKKKLSSIRKSWQDEKERFSAERQTIEQQLAQETTKLQAAQDQLVTNQQAYEQERGQLLTQLEDQRKKLVRTANELMKDGDDSPELQEELETERQNLVSIKDYLDDAEHVFHKIESELRSKICQEQKVVNQLQSQLQVQQEQFEKERTDLEERIRQEEVMIQEVEEQLASERLEFARDKLRLEGELAEQIRLRALKRQQMKRRFDKIRTEMTALWQGARRDARREKQFLTKKYESKLAVVGNSTAQLESELSAARLANDNLSQLLQQVQQQKDAVIQQAEQAEQRYLVMIADRNAQIDQLKGDLKSLRAQLKRKDEELEYYKSSVRKQLKSSVKLTGRRFRNVFRRNSQDKKDD